MVASPAEQEFLTLCRKLESYHELFAMIWEIGAPVFTDSVETAAIVFNPTGKPLRFLFNPKFWAELPEYDRQFVVCHEMLHAVLNHGFRSRDMLLPKYMNIAADLAVNHLLIERFGFVRELVRDWSSLCWVDTIFTPPYPATNLTMEQYYEELFNRPMRQAALLDEHCFMSGPLGSLRGLAAAAEMDALLADLDAAATLDVRSKLGKEGSAVAQRGTQQVCAWCAILPERVTQVPWEDIVRRRLRPKDEELLAAGWVLTDRRHSGDSGLSVPGHAVGIVREDARKRQRCVFFLDTSGSVFHLRHRFFALVKSLPPHQFDVVACSFDMQVMQLDLKRPEVYGGGGTSFSILEDWIQADRRKRGGARKARYPDVVFVLTDGYGDTVRPEHPDRWHWLMTTECLAYVPEASARYFLKDFG